MARPIPRDAPVTRATFPASGVDKWFPHPRAGAVHGRLVPNSSASIGAHGLPTPFGLSTARFAAATETIHRRDAEDAERTQNSLRLCGLCASAVTFLVTSGRQPLRMRRGGRRRRLAVRLRSYPAIRARARR